MTKYPKNVPRVIYLQTGAEKGEPISDVDFTGVGTSVSWCADKIWDSDIRYVLDRDIRKLRKLIQAIRELCLDPKEKDGCQTVGARVVRLCDEALAIGVGDERD